MGFGSLEGMPPMMSGSPCVTVVVPVYNSVGTLRRAVESVSAQTLRDFELLIVDDCSPDASRALALQLASTEPRIRVIPLPNNQGKSFAMNRAISEARGRWIAVLDADDWYEPERLDILVSVAEACGLPLVADNQNFHDAGAAVLTRSAFSVDAGTRQLTRQNFIAGCDPWSEFNFGMLKPVVRADFIRQTGLRYRENARLSEDFLYLVEFFAAGGSGMLVAKPLYNWTQAFGPVSHQWTTTGAGAWRYDFGAALTANGDVRQELLAHGQHDLADLLSERARAFNNLHRMNEINRARSLGAPMAEVLMSIARHPSIWPRLARRAMHAVRRRERAVSG
jgi:succinoglycan biosynthesis protein ExoO